MKLADTQTALTVAFIALAGSAQALASLNWRQYA